MASSRASNNSTVTHPSCDQFTMAMINRYLKTTGIEEEFRKQCHELLKSSRLPYNPYPILVRGMRSYAESFIYLSVDDEDIYQRLVCQVQDTNIREITKPASGDSIYGTASCIKMIYPSELNQYRWLLNDVTPHVSRLKQIDGYVNQVVTALLAPSMLHGTFYPDPPSINFRVEFIIIGPDENRAVALFLESITDDIFHIHSSGTHVFLGLKVPVKDPNNDGVWQNVMFSTEKLHQDKNETWGMIYDALVKEQEISAECLFRLSDGGDTYKRGNKQYCLNYVEIDEEKGEEKGFHFFSDLPFATLYEGVFLQRSYAEAYVNTFLKRLRFFDKNLDEAAQPEGRTASLGPAPQLKLIIANCQKKIAGLQSPQQIFEIVHYALTLVTTEKDLPPSLTADLYKVLRSAAAQLFNLMLQNRTIQELIMHFTERRSSPVVNKLFRQYMNSAIEFFGMEEVSDDIKTVGQVVMRSLTEITDGETSDVPINDDTLNELIYINIYCRGLFYQLAEDVLGSLHELSRLIAEVQEAFSDLAPLPPEHIETSPSLHGMEDKDIMEHDSRVLNVQSCMRKVSRRQQIAKETVLLTYVVDTHLDEVWTEFLVDLFTEVSSRQPTNPFPLLVSTLRRATLRMELYAETDDELQRRIQMPHHQEQEDDAAHHIYTIPGHSVYGLKSALSAVDVTVFSVKVMPIIEAFLRDDDSYEEDVYKVEMSCAVSGHCTLYGVVDPYLWQINLHEHCYITGPAGCEGDAIPLYAKLVYDELLAADHNLNNVVMGMYMGQEENLWGIEDVKRRQRGFMAELEHRFVANEPVCWKIFVWLEWRYVPVVKHLRLHYWNRELTKHKIFYPENVADVYQYVFHSREKMLLHVKYGGFPLSGDPYSERILAHALEQVNQSALDAKKRLDWLNVHRWLLTGQLMQNDESLVVEVWRSMHSPAAQYTHLMILGKCLSDIIRCGLELRKALVTRNNEISVLKREDQIRDELVRHIDQLVRNAPDMLDGYREKLLQVSEQSSSLAPRCLPQVMVQKLNTLKTEDGKIVIGEKAELVLKEIETILTYVQDVVMQIMHGHSRRVASILDAIEAELDSRPKSVASVQLGNMRW